VTCTLAAIAMLYGREIQPGATIDIPSAYVERLTIAERSHARSCLRHLKLRYRIVGG
jgi:hypothetical protein